VPVSWPRHIERVAAQLVGDPSARPVAILVAPDGTGRTHALDAVADLLNRAGHTTERVSARRSTPDIRSVLGVAAETVVIDDAHWCDDASITAIEDVVVDGGSIIVAHRPDERMDALDAVFARVGSVVRPEPPSVDDVADRIEVSVGSRPDPRTTEHVHALTAGHARLTDALVTAVVAADGAWDDEAARARLDALPVVELQIGELSPAARVIVAALSLGTTVDDQLLAELADVPVGSVGAAWRELRAAGLLVPGHDEALPIVGRAVSAQLEASARRDLHRRLAEALRSRGAPSTQVAEHLVAAEARGPDAAEVLTAAAEATVAEAPEVALELLDRAVAAGADPFELAARRAEAAVLTGDEDRALAEADAALAGPSREHARSAVVMAAVLARRGLWERAAQTYATTTGHPVLPDDAVRALGRVAEVATGIPGSPTVSDRPAPLIGEVCRGLGHAAASAGIGDAPAALAAAYEAAELVEATGSTVALPETPHAVGATVALAVGDSDAAELLMTRALDGDVGGPATRARHQLLWGLAAMRAGRWDRAQRALDTVLPDATTTRDSLFRCALSAGLARRTGDVAGLLASWEGATPALTACRGDLFLLPALTELGIAGARVADRSHIDTRLAELDAVLVSLGRPALWTRPVAWARVEAAIAGLDRDALAEAADRLAATSAAHERLGGLELGATAWCAVLDGRGEPETLDAGVAAIERAGLAWEAAQLVGQAAIRADDPADTRSLLGRARSLKARSLESGLPTTADDGPTSETPLSDREREVAASVVDGLTHKEIGALLFISPKTVEHHVARIRQKLGATSRAEMLAALRTVLAAATDA
jgi:DNA-binding CsgD family transcriptional regulator